eukprot:3630894-Amphidinium_carterae.3
MRDLGERLGRLEQSSASPGMMSPSPIALWDKWCGHFQRQWGRGLREASKRNQGISCFVEVGPGDRAGTSIVG